MTKQEIARHTLITIIDTLYNENRIGACTRTALKDGISELNRPCPTLEALLYEAVEPKIDEALALAERTVDRMPPLLTFTVRHPGITIERPKEFKLKVYLDN